jgi:UDP-N-acetylmuramoyl-tripeptide--D-alanyl-D-alanine ligase
MANRRAHPLVTYIGVTGSCGKTTTASLIGSVLSTGGQCCTHAGANRLELVADNILSVGRATDYCVQEITGNRRNTIRKTTRMLKPQIGVVTTIGSDHYKWYRSLEAVAEEKSKLVQDLPKRGVAILNSDDPHVHAMATRTRAKAVTYGRFPGADFRASDVSSIWPDRLSLTLVHGNETLYIRTKLVGEFWATSVLAAFACGTICGLDPAVCAEAIANFEPVFARSSVHSVPNGPSYILETEKAPLWTIANSLYFVRQARAPAKTIVFGTISDYAGKGGRTHRKVARQALEVADRVIFVGPQAGHVSKLREGKVSDRLFAFETSYQAAKFLTETAIADELIYVKSSIRDHLERIMLARVESVVCWKERCQRFYVSCPECGAFRKPSRPPWV